MKVKAMLVALFAVAGLVFTSCDSGKTGDTVISHELTIYPSTSANAGAMADYIRSLYADKLGSNIYSVSVQKEDKENSDCACYKLAVSYNLSNDAAAEKAFAAVKACKSSIVAKMNELGIWRTSMSCTGFVDEGWTYDHNVAIGTWSGKFTDDSNVEHTLTLKINDEFTDTSDAGELYTTLSSIIIDSETPWTPTLYYRGTDATLLKFSYANGVVSCTYKIWCFIDLDNRFDASLTFKSDNNDVLLVKELRYNNHVASNVTLSRK